MNIPDTLNIEQDDKNDSVFTFVSLDSLQMVSYPNYLWKPQSDITAYELALCLPIVVTSNTWGVESLPDEAKRHFERIEEP